MQAHRHAGTQATGTPECRDAAGMQAHRHAGTQAAGTQAAGMQAAGMQARFRRHSFRSSILIKKKKRKK